MLLLHGLTGKNKQAWKEGKIRGTAVLVKSACSTSATSTHPSSTASTRSSTAKDDGVSFHLVSATAPNPRKQSPPLPSSHPRPASLNSPRRLLPYTACVSVFLLALSLQSVLLISIQNKRTSSADLVPFLFLPEPIFVIYTVFIFPKGRCNQRWQGSQFFRVTFEWSNDS